MHIKIKHALLLSILSITSYTLFAQASLDSIINSYFTAIGGKDKIQQINSEYMEGTLEVMGNSGTSTTYVLNGKGFKNVVDFGGQQVIQVITDTGAWTVNPFMGSPDPTPLPKDQYTVAKDQIYIGGALLHYPSDNSTSLQLLGTENVDGKPAYKIQAVNKDSVKTTYYIDSAMHYLVQLSREFGGQTTTAKYSDFRQTDYGNTMPFKEELNTPQGIQLTITVTKAEINKPIDTSVFDMPKKQ